MIYFLLKILLVPTLIFDHDRLILVFINPFNLYMFLISNFSNILLILFLYGKSMANSHQKMGKNTLYKNEQIQKYLGEKKQLLVPLSCCCVPLKVGSYVISWFRFVGRIECFLDSVLTSKKSRASQLYHFF